MSELTWNRVLPVPDGEERRMEQRVAVVPGGEYAISFYYAVREIPTVATQCTIFATFDHYTLLKDVPLPDDSNYHLYEARFIAADNLDPAIEVGVACPYVGNGYTATVQIDDVDVRSTVDCTPVDPGTPPQPTLLVPAIPAPPSCPRNLMQNPSFDPINGAQAWSIYNNGGEILNDVSKARTGDYSAYEFHLDYNHPN